MKPTIILLHGALGSSRQMIKIEERFKPNYRVLSMNFMGHGGSEMPNRFSIADFVQQLKEFIDEHRLTDFSIFGYSMGGYVALKYALGHSRTIDHIFTFGTKFSWTNESAAEEVKKLNPDVLEEKVPHFANWLKETHGEANWRTVLSNTEEFMLSLGQSNELLNDDLSNITCLVTVAVGDEDNMVGIDESQNVVNRLANARLKVLKGAKHPIEKLSSDHFQEMTRGQ